MKGNAAQYNELGSVPEESTIGQIKHKNNSRNKCTLNGFNIIEVQANKRIDLDNLQRTIVELLIEQYLAEHPNDPEAIMIKTMISN